MRFTLVFVGLHLLLFSQTGHAASASDHLDRSGVRGGLVVHIGCDRAELLAHLAARPGFILHALDRDPVKVKHARSLLLSRGLYGKISVALFDGEHLPYAENLVNLLIADKPQIEIPREEILRVLVPNGIALINGHKIQKPVPPDIDEWSHFEHGPENNAVAADTAVGPPRHLQWVAGPRWLRTHEEPSGVSSMVTAGGRLFYTLDEGPIGISDARMPEKWSVMARDAFNGTQLWKIPLPNWGWQTWKSEFKEKYQGLDWIKTSGLRTKNPSSYRYRMVADDECLYFTLGIMPANGMTYVPADQCFCSAGVKLLGLNALCAAQTFGPIASVRARLEEGPAYGKVSSDSGRAQWPAFRHDALRSGATSAQVAAKLKPAWELQLDPSITQPVVSDSRLFVASRDTHTIHALDSQRGSEYWRFTAGGRIDSSPTLWQGLLLFGSADGHAYCLRQTDGALVWRFRAAPHQRLIQSFGQLESAWPLHGSVLMLDDLAYVSAGRSTFLDGGLYLYALEPATGKVVYQHQELGPYEDHTQGFGHSFWSEGARNDVLVSDGEAIYVMQLRFTKQLKPNPAQTESLLGDRKFGRHIFSTAGFLDDEWYNRAFWMNSTVWPGFYLANQASKSGQLLVANETTTFGVKAFWTRNRHTPMFFPGTKGYLLFADDNDSEPMLVGRDKGRPLTWLPPFNMNKGKKPKTNWGPKLSAAPQMSSVDAYTYNKDKGIGFTRNKQPIWSTYLPIRVKAMVSTKGKLFIAGALDVFDEQNDPLGAFEGRKGGVLRAVSAQDGSTLSEYPLVAPPVLDGLIAVEGKLLLATRDGRLSCWE